MGRHVLADEVRPDRQLAVPAVDQHRELDPRGPAEVHQRVHRGADRATREQHVVHQDDRRAGDVERDPRLVHLGRLGLQPDVVAVERDVEHADRHVRALDPGDLGGEAPRQVVAAVRDPDQRQPAGALVSLDDLVGDAGERPADVVGVEQLPTHENAPLRVRGRRSGCVASVAPFPASRDRT